MHTGERVLRWFARAGGSKACFYVVIYSCLLWYAAGERLPVGPHWTFFDPFPYIFLMGLLTVFGVLQNIALQYLATDLAGDTTAIQRTQEIHLTRIEQVEDTILSELRAMDARLMDLIAWEERTDE